MDNPEVSTSDEFNQKTLDTTRWTYRTKGKGWGKGPEYVAFVNDGTDAYVSIKGSWSERKGSGITAKNETHFGFYTLRYRVSGLDPAWKTPWHPSVWMAAKNCAIGEDRREIKNSHKNVEIDFMEYYFFPTWNSHIIAWDGARHKGTAPLVQRIVHKDSSIATDWHVLGLEYTPDYFQLWRQIDGEWSQVESAIPITDAPNSDESINRSHAKPGYWTLSNKEHFDSIKKGFLMRNRSEDEYDDFLLEDSSLDIDYFRYFPAKSE